MPSPVKSLQGQQHELSSSFFQLQVLQQPTVQGEQFPLFTEKLQQNNLYPLKPTGTTILQVNVGKMCNQVCKHCHVDAGPDRKEIMTRDTMQFCLDALVASPQVNTVDLTGGAPEMNPNFRWFVEELSKLGKQVIVRCNLTIILANKKYHDLPLFFKKHKVQVVSSLPYFSASRTDAQRGEGVFEKSVKALQMLNEAGYGKEGSGLQLDLVYNPSGAFLPSGQKALEGEFKRRLRSGYNIEFNNLYCITNLPVSRYLDYLIASGNYSSYMEKLINAFNPAAAANVMCRNTISVGWDGYLYDCDFNQMLELKVAGDAPAHIQDFNLAALDNRSIVLNQHCYGCTAGAGSSCGGEVVAI
ncbi:arsenosugar biosynthesis radical SAM (seleno)protein ArsS [Pontibacter sp. SGAir0037]|uniref:arsenosugar biosynthesis radical SAM (seleno)protein ArsS n=1 Tax=Pontibacter sp. SGAir0037 TaxID=2571030 RepID=UPI0010CD1EFE|nr:arsenosugar biosynthesis radical SAM (seleno)protein ArsS [Pontibacter sp. SGAir0037]QCR23133.1 radical SAM protein [Pontibacter sp. SGAir0037]